MTRIQATVVDPPNTMAVALVNRTLLHLQAVVQTTVIKVVDPLNTMAADQLMVVDHIPPHLVVGHINLHPVAVQTTAIRVVVPADTMAAALVNTILLPL